jgi:hypothetical protein
VHQATDGALVRVRLPGGMLTAAQLATLATASSRFGSGKLELTRPRQGASARDHRFGGDCGRDRRGRSTACDRRGRSTACDRPRQAGIAPGSPARARLYPESLMDLGEQVLRLR